MNAFATSFLLLVASASGATVSLTPIADAFVTAGSMNTSSGSPTANYGGAGALQVSGAETTKGEIQSLLKFDLATATAQFDAIYGSGNWMVQSITLQLGTNFGTQGTQPNNAIFNSINTGMFSIDWLANDNWGEGSGNPGNPFLPSNPPTDGVTFTSLGSLLSSADLALNTFQYLPVGNTNPPTVPPATYALTLGSSFLADVIAGNNVSLRAYAADNAVSYLFNSRTYGMEANKPVLLVQAVPEPSTGGLFAITCLGWLLKRRRHVSAA